MLKKILLFNLLMLTCLNSYAAWDFRGEPNNWGTTRMFFLSGDRHFIRQSFSPSQDEFKIAKEGGWAVSFPVKNFTLAPAKTYDIFFSEIKKTIQVDEVPSNESWVFRGTPNGWGVTPLSKVGDLFKTCQTFGTDQPAFKISNGNKGEWVESYPEQNFRVAVNTSLDITFNPATRTIQTTQRTGTCSGSASLDIHRSLIVHDQATLDAADFSFGSVLQQLTNQINAENPAATTNTTELFARFWDTQNPAPGFVSGGPKCELLLNGFPNDCRANQEGVQAQIPQDFMANYRPIALINRFDLRDTVNFNDCGEYRVIFALTNSFSGRNFIIFESQLPNPVPGNASGCAPIVNLWKNLSAENDVVTRAKTLRDFYFTGIPSQNVKPVIDIHHYAVGSGQIRTNQFMSGGPWVLKEFKISIENGLGFIKPVSVKANPFGPLFGDGRVDSLASNFRNQFLANLNSLLVGDLSTFSLTMQEDSHNNGRSHASGFETFENDFRTQVATGSGAFKRAIDTRAAQLGSNLTADQVLNRATAMTCGGCHNPGSFGLTSPNSVANGQSWPDTLGFTHLSEFAFNGFFSISPALENVFLPARKRGMEAFIDQLKASALQNKALSNTSDSPATLGSLVSVKSARSLSAPETRNQQKAIKSTSPAVTGKRSG
jgi:hypothetical protein